VVRPPRAVVEWLLVVEVVVEKTLVRVVVAAVGCWDDEEWERERQREGDKTGKRLIFWLTLDTIFFPLRAWNLPLFISGGIGQSCLHWGKIAALDSVGKDPNRWFKVGIPSCQICRKRLTKLAYLGRCRHRWVVIKPERAI